MSIIPVLIVLILAQRYFVQGLTLTGLKSAAEPQPYLSVPS
mgnify:CR=1 FL=1